MSLVSLATRVIFGEMLKGRTWAEDRIIDSPLDPIAEVLRSTDGSGKPVIAVYTSKATGKPVGMDTQGGAQSIDLMVYAYLPPKSVSLPEGIEFTIDNTGAGLALDTMGRQIDAATHYGNEDWVRLWRGFVLNVEEREARFVLVELERGLPVPCVEVKYSLRTIAEADFGREIYAEWAKLDAALRATERADDTQLADLIKGLIESPADLEDFEQFQMNFGLSDAAHQATGLAPLAVTEDGEAPLLEELVEPLLDEMDIVAPGL